MVLPDVQRIQVEQALEQLRRASAARDVRALRRAIADCTDDVQALEIAEGQPPIDLLTDASNAYALPQILARRPCYGQGARDGMGWKRKKRSMEIHMISTKTYRGDLFRRWQAAFASTQLEGAATRRISQVQEVKDLAQDQKSGNGLAALTVKLYFSCTFGGRIAIQEPCSSGSATQCYTTLATVPYGDGLEMFFAHAAGVVTRSRLLAVDLAGKRSVDRTVSQAIARSAARPQLWVTANHPTNSSFGDVNSLGYQVLTSLLQDCFGADRGRIALVICLPPAAPDREKVLTVLEVRMLHAACGLT
eukprot:Skav232194  [mRNA]  locus=scaffold4523:118370:124517:- [translate_table: standard]